MIEITFVHEQSDIYTAEWPALPGLGVEVMLKTHLSDDRGRGYIGKVPLVVERVVCAADGLSARVEVEEK